jgi:molybdenum cofactor cytidylyltransferase
MTDISNIGAVILAAGQSQRMGKPKMVLPWGSTTVIGRVITVLLESGLATILTVSGGAKEQVEAAIAEFPVRTAHNPGYAVSDMLESLKIGIRSLEAEISAVLVVLGDQPQIECRTVETIIERYLSQHSSLVVPSYKMRRGHPWLIDSILWPDIMKMTAGQNMREFLNAYRDQIDYVDVPTPSILKDLDTPEDYSKERP